MVEIPFEALEELADNELVDGVRFSNSRITIANAPEERFVEQIPQQLVDDIRDTFEDTVWVAEGAYHTHAVERHSYRNGIFNDPVCKASEMPEGYELQFHLVV